VSNRSSLRREELQIKFAAAILVEFFFFCGPAGSLAVALPAAARPVFGSWITCLSLGFVPLISYLPHHLSSLVARGGRRVMMFVSGAISRACHEVRLLIGWPAARRLIRRPSSQREAWAVKLSELLVCRIRGGSRAVSPS
jgi:hypothetical protein